MADKKSIIQKYEPLWSMWRVDELIEKGSCWEVYRVYKEEWGKRYVSAVKIISVAAGRNDIQEARVVEAGIKNILNEIEVMYKLRGNSNIVTYEDHAIYERKDSKGWDILIRMEYLEPLPNYMVSHELSICGVIKLGMDICNALEACERENIIHRDIKDVNIFVSKNGDFKLGNFSIARELSKEGRAMPGGSSPIFRAPEVLKESSCDSSVDTYSLGMVMYKLLNRGRLPFLPLPPSPVTIMDTENSILSIMAGKEPAPPADAGEKLGAVILKACSYSGKDRFRSPVQLKQKLERIYREESKTARTGKIIVTGRSEGYDAAPDIIGTEAGPSAEEEAAITLQASVGEAPKPAVKPLPKRLILAAGAVIIAAGLFAALLNSAGSSGIPENKAPQVVQPSPAEVKAYEPEAAITPAPTDAVEASDASNQGEEYYNRGMAYLKKKQYTKAMSTFEEAKKLGYSRDKADRQIRTVKRLIEIESLYMSAMENYEGKNYEKAAASFAELIERDASYKNVPQYADCFFQMASSHNLLGVRYCNDGKLEAALSEFEAASESLTSMKACGNTYDSGLYAKWSAVYEGNRDELITRINRVDEHLRQAEEHNRSGVKLFNGKNYYKARQEFEAAVKHMYDIRVLVPKYSGKSYEGLLKIYSDNLKKVESEQ